MKTTLKLAFGLAATALVASTSSALTLEKTPFGKQTIPDNPQRIVLLDLGAADDLIALNATDRVVGIATHEFFPKWVTVPYANKVDVGGLGKPNFEAIAKLKPDLIVVSRRGMKHNEKLAEIAPVYNHDIDYADSLGSIKLNALNWGKILGKEDLANKLVAALDARIADVNKSIKNKTALAVIANERKVAAYAEQSRFGIIYAGQGFNFIPVDKNLKEDRHGINVSFEYLLEKNPQFLFVVDRTGAISTVKDNVAKTFDNDYAKKLAAYKNNAICVVNPANWYMGFGGISVTNTIVNEVADCVNKSKYVK